MDNTSLVFAKFEICEYNVPSQFMLSTNVDNLVTSAISETKNFSLELKAIKRYADVKRVSSFKRTESPSTVPASNDLKSTSPPPSQNNDLLIFSPQSMSPTSATLQPNMAVALPIATDTGITSQTHAAVKGAGASGPVDKVADMMNRTGASRDECYFYLESMSGDVEEAIAMYEDNRK